MSLYDAFISYSHARDKLVAAALQGVIQRLGKPWYRRRAARLFRDDTSLSATPGLWPAIEQALGQSRYLVVLASPQFAASKWCGLEVAWWLEHREPETLLIAVTDGELIWGEAAGDFLWNERTPLPALLKGHFKNEPKWIDFRAWREAPDASDPKFVDAAADLAAAVRGVPKEDLLSQEVRQQKRALRLAWSAAAVVTLLAVGAGWQWYEAEAARHAALAAEKAATEQRQVAETERDRAEHNLALARKAAEDLVFRIAQGLRDVQGMRVATIRRILDTAQEMMDELMRSAPDDPHLQRSRAAMFVEFVDTYLAAGDLWRARAAAEESLAIFRRLAVADPGNAVWRRDLSVSLDKVGDVRLAAGDRAGALAVYEESLGIIRKLVDADAGNVGWRRDLSVSFEKIGDARLAAGDRADALAAYEESLAIRRKLADTDPRNAEWRRDLSVGLNKVGDVRLAKGDRAGALAAYEESLAIRRELAATDPGNANWRRDLSVSLEKIGDLRRATGDRAAALAVYEESLAIRRKLADTDPGNTEWQWDVNASLDRVGDVRMEAGDRAGAIAAYEESLAIMRKVAAAGPDNAGWQRGLSVSLNKVGDVRLGADDRAGALTAYEESLAIVRKLVAADPSNAGWQADLVVSLYKVSTVSDSPQARETLREAIALAEKLEREDKLTASQRAWPRLLREALAKLPAETAGTN